MHRRKGFFFIMLVSFLIISGCSNEGVTSLEEIYTPNESNTSDIATPEEISEIVSTLETEDMKEGTEKPPRPYVLLSPTRGEGDFGPHTPGTKTAGWQEALDYCVKNSMDLYVKGGYGGQNAVFHISDTIRFPPAQDFRVDGGVYVINWTGPGDKDLMVIDSCMNCELHFGILVYGGTGAAMRVKPENPVPIDNFPIMVETEIHSQGMADPHPFTPGERLSGSGLVFDGSKAVIVHSKFIFFGVLNFRTVIETKGVFANNQFEVLHLHTNAHKSTLFRMGEQSSANSFKMAIGVDQGASEVTGVVLDGDNNTLEIMPRPSNQPFDLGRILILDSNAEGNQINFVTQQPEIILGGITDLSKNSNNQISWTGNAAPIQTIIVKEGIFYYTQSLFPATARLTGGQLTSLKFVRGDTTVDYTSAPGTSILLSVGDRLEIESSGSPVLEIIPLKLK